MKNSWESKKILAYGKRFSVFTSIMLVLLFAFSCSNLIMNDGGSLIIAVPGARAASASSYTIELTGANGTTQSKTLAGGTTAQFDDLDPDTYNISVKGKDDSGLVVLYGMSNATVEAGATASATVKLGTVANDLNSLQQAVTAGGIVYIGSDINVDSTLTVNTDVTLLPFENNVTLFKKASNINLISVTAGTFTVGGDDYYTITLDGDSDNYSDTSTTGLIYVATKVCTINLKKNSVVENNSRHGLYITGAGALDSSKARLYLDGGIIQGNQMAGVNLSNTIFEMTDGLIQTNKVTGVNVGSSTFVMKGGRIYKNETTNNGGGVSLTSGGSFTMDGGSIEENSATGNGGGVYNPGTFIMNGGTISGNTAGSGKGVYTSKNITMSGNADVTPDNDVHIGDGCKITITSLLKSTIVLTPTNYTSVWEVLAVENGVSLSDVIKKITLTQPTDGSGEYYINEEGKLKPVTQ